MSSKPWSRTPKRKRARSITSAASSSSIDQNSEEFSGPDAKRRKIDSSMPTASTTEFRPTKKRGRGFKFDHKCSLCPTLDFENRKQCLYHIQTRHADQLLDASGKHIKKPADLVKVENVPPFLKQIPKWQWPAMLAWMKKNNLTVKSMLTTSSAPQTGSQFDEFQIPDFISNQTEEPENWRESSFFENYENESDTYSDFGDSAFQLPFGDDDDDINDINEALPLTQTQNQNNSQQQTQMDENEPSVRVSHQEPKISNFEQETQVQQKEDKVEEIDEKIEKVEEKIEKIEEKVEKVEEKKGKKEENLIGKFKNGIVEFKVTFQRIIENSLKLHPEC